ncbi:Crp/Fnr family transcriptional regulator [Sphingomonas parva]|uniref:Crp/Fnr family transcriptional regulator n=1 Tax=Sphingomonas parva TaxID=2555898 RepID=UPI001430CEB0|nr:Crp/Fnr family transcriptional regulator [Sphingomonas parva]
MEIGPRRQGLQLFLQRLSLRSDLNGEEREALLALPGQPQRVEAHRDIVGLGDDVDHACLVLDGLVGRFAQLSDGRRQTIGLHSPGDMADLYSLMMPKAPSALHALTKATVLRIPHAALRKLTARYPAVGAAFWRDCVVDGNVMGQWLLNVGRREARGRLAHLICELAVRISRSERPSERSYPIRITQEQLADALGLTSVHVNRTLKALREEGLASLAKGQVHIEDWDALAAAAEFDPSYLGLPESRVATPALSVQGS